MMARLVPLGCLVAPADRWRRSRWRDGRGILGPGRTASSFGDRHARRLLGVSEWDAGVEGGGDERMPQGVGIYQVPVEEHFLRRAAMTRARSEPEVVDTVGAARTAGISLEQNR